MLLFRPQIHKNPQQQKFNNRSNLHSRSRGVAKVSFGLPMLHGKHFFLCFPCSVGTSKTLFATPPQREGLFFSLFWKFPSEKLQNHENAVFEPLLRHHVANDANSKSLKIRRLPRREGFGPKIALRENARIRSRILHFSNGFQQISKIVLYENVSILSTYVKNPLFFLCESDSQKF